MAAVTAVGALARLADADDDYLTVEVGLFAELDDGRRVQVDPARWTIGGPRRGVGAVWVSYDGHLDGSIRDLPGFDPELFARDPGAAVTAALDVGYRLRPRDIEDAVREDLFGDDRVWGGETAAEFEQRRRDSEEEREQAWSILVSQLAAERVRVRPTALMEAPFHMAFDAALLAELSR